MAGIELSNVSIRLGSTTAIDDVCFRVEPGEILALLGPNGAGKSTVVNVICGYLKPNYGSVRVLGVDPVADRKSVATRWGVMPQSGGLPMGLTVAETVELFCRLGASEASPAELVELVGLSNHSKQRWRKLSGGEQQRLSLAVTLCGGREVLVLDEPTAAIDVAGRTKILELIQHQAENGAAVLMTTHMFTEADQIASHAVVIDRGRVLASGPTTELRSKTNSVRFQSRPGLPLDKLTAALGARVTETSPGSFRITDSNQHDLVAQLTSWLAQNQFPIDNLQTTESLEQVFMSLTNSENQ